MKLVGYLRVSTIEQAEHGFGLDMQDAAISSAAKKLGARVVATYRDEGRSGTLDAADRPGLTDALALLRTGHADGLIVRDLDRLARAVSVQEAVLAEVWGNNGAAVFTSIPPQEVARDDPDDPMRTAMRQMAGVFNELNRRLIVKQLRDGRTTKAAKGGHATGSPPYGWRTDKDGETPNGALVPVPEEQTALARMRQLSAKGAPLQAIAATLTAEGHPTKRGGTWSAATVMRILKRTEQKASA
jgi:DNA invertase Pin-like site-specific DNA recombinase